MEEIFKKLPQLRFRGQAPAMHYNLIALQGLNTDDIEGCEQWLRVFKEV